MIHPHVVPLTLHSANTIPKINHSLLHHVPLHIYRWRHLWYTPMKFHSPYTLPTQFPKSITSCCTMFLSIFIGGATYDFTPWSSTHPTLCQHNYQNQSLPAAPCSPLHLKMAPPMILPHVVSLTGTLHSANTIPKINHSLLHHVPRYTYRWRHLQYGPACPTLCPAYLPMLVRTLSIHKSHSHASQDKPQQNANPCPFQSISGASVNVIGYMKWSNFLLLAVHVNAGLETH